jgi:hypothetical protein
MQRTQIYLEPEQHRALIDEATKRGVSLAELMRQVVAAHLEQIPGARSATPEIYRRIIGLGGSGKSDVAERHDDYLAEAIDHEHNG